MGTRYINLLYFLSLYLVYMYIYIYTFRLIPIVVKNDVFLFTLAKLIKCLKTFTFYSYVLDKNTNDRNPGFTISLGYFLEVVERSHAKESEDFRRSKKSNAKLRSLTLYSEEILLEWKMSIFAVLAVNGKSNRDGFRALVISLLQCFHYRFLEAFLRPHSTLPSSLY